MLGRSTNLPNVPLSNGNNTIGAIILEFIYEYGLFLAKAVTIIITIGIILALIAASSQKNRGAGSENGTIEITKFNEQYDETKKLLRSAVLDQETLKKENKAVKKAEKAKKKESSKDEKNSRKRVYIIDFEGDIKASAVENLREEITAVLTLATPEDEVIVRLESTGGMVHSYGLASSQLKRIVDKEIPLTVCVDKVAASGGYMMACVAPKICSAPFAIIGSIGVVAQLPNFHRLLKKNDIDFELLTAGEYKRTLTMFGENTDKGREKFTEDLETTHQLFKDFVIEQRDIVDIDKVATGEIWFGQQAKDMRLVDELITSDDYIIQQVDNADIYGVTFTRKKSLPERFGMSLQASLVGAVEQILNKINFQRFLS